MKTVYIVLRHSADGPELDCFTNETMAQHWAEVVGESVITENIIDEATLDAMIETRKDFA